jgi:hypothetical protein
MHDDPTPPINIYFHSTENLSDGLMVTMNQHHFCTTVPPLSGVDLPQNGQLFDL